jgi:hypothetical protein
MLKSVTLKNSKPRDVFFSNFRVDKSFFIDEKCEKDKKIYDFAAFRKKLEDTVDEDLMRFDNTLYSQQIKAMEHGYKTGYKECVFTNGIKITFEIFDDDPDEIEAEEEYVKRV